MFSGQLSLDMLLVNADDADVIDHVCSLPHANMSVTGWNSTDVMLGPGDYVMILEVVVHNKHNSFLFIDNVTLLNENCTYDELEYGKAAL